MVTKYVTDFLGFGNFIRIATHPKARHSENEIYRYIADCQVFLAYHADETKPLKRRKTFRKSIGILHNLVLGGSIKEANRRSSTKYLFGTPKDNPMIELDYKVAERVLKHELCPTTAAAIMVFVGLHAAYNSVLAFTSALNRFLQEMYDFANPHKNPRKQLNGKPKWLTVQELAFENDDKSEAKLQRLVEDAERRSIKLPLVRVARDQV